MARQQRIQVDDAGLPAPVVQPTAAPVDTYRGPGAAGSQLAQLARGLSSLVPGVQQFAQTVGQKQATDAQQQAAMDVQKAHFQQGKSYAKAIKDGSIPPTASPYYMQSFKERYGRVTADGFGSFLQGQIEANQDLATAVDPAQAGNLFDHVAQNAMNTYLKDQASTAAGDQDFHVGFDNRAAAYIAQEKQLYIKSLNARVKKFSDDLVFQEIHQHIHNSIGAGAPDAEIVDEVNKAMTADIAAGNDGTAVNHAAIDAFAAAALQDPVNGNHILDLALQLKGANGASLGDTRYALQVLDKTRQELVKRNQRIATAQREQDELDKQNRASKAYSDAFDWMDQHPEDSTGLLKIASSVKDIKGAFGTILSLRDDFGKLKYSDDPDVKQELNVGVWDDPQTTTQEKIVSFLKDRKITPGTAQNLMSLLQMRKHVDGKDGGDGIGDPRLKTAFNSAMTNLGKTLGEKDPMTILPPRIAKRVRDAKAEFHQWFYDALENNLVPEDRGHWEKWLNDKAEEIRKYESQGLEDMTKTEAPPAKFAKTRQEMEKALPKDPALTLDDIKKYRVGIASPNLQKWANQLGIAQDPDGMSLFIAIQRDRLKAQHVKE